MAFLVHKWAVDPTHYKAHPDAWVAKEFASWANHEERVRHLKKGQAELIVKMLSSSHREKDPLPFFHKQLKEGVKTDLFTPTTLCKIIDKAAAIFEQKNTMKSISTVSAEHHHHQQRLRKLSHEQKFILFNKHPDDSITACFGNYYEVPGGVFGCRTAEGAFQAHKFIGNPYSLFAPLDGESAWALGKTLDRPQKASWHRGKRKLVMKDVIANKFKRGSPLAAALLATGSAYLVAHSDVKGRDVFWSDASDGSGQNMLGKILMERRQALGGTGIVPTPGEYSRNVRNQN